MLSLLLLAVLAQDPVPTDKDGEFAVRKLKDECAKASIDGKIAALLEAVKTEHEKVLKAIGEMMLTEADPVRIAAAAALGGADHPASAEALVAAVVPNLRREEVLPAILKAIGELGWQTAAGRLNDLLSKVADADVRAAMPGVVATLGQLGSPSSIDPLIDLLLKLEGGKKNPWPNEGQLRREAESALRAITGMDIRRVADWQPWWHANQEILRQKMSRTFWLKKTQDRVDVTATEKSPADGVLVASRLPGFTPTAAASPKKKKKGNK
jgi:PBS lyase HEAT-like repeat-containing protein